MELFANIIKSNDPSAEVRAKALRELSEKLREMILAAIRQVMFYPALATLGFGIILIICGVKIHPRQVSSIVGGAVVSFFSFISLLIATIIYFAVIKKLVNKWLTFEDGFEERSSKLVAGSKGAASKAKSKVSNLKAMGGSILT
eukprot:Phypoly_transcript_22295.p1 GENE.Phypoly_transcript_22295~~Phypoly_transcript_22295.p1  ORF type:complete len:153 (+),score=11.68 Phypoly_transcript_22295:30-461(+)